MLSRRKSQIQTPTPTTKKESFVEKAIRAKVKRDEERAKREIEVDREKRAELAYKLERIFQIKADPDDIVKAEHPYGTPGRVAPHNGWIARYSYETDGFVLTAWRRSAAAADYDFTIQQADGRRREIVNNLADVGEWILGRND